MNAPVTDDAAAANEAHDAGSSPAADSGFQPMEPPPAITDSPQGEAPAAAPATPQRTALDELASAVLDAAELANRGAQAAAGVSARLHEATQELNTGQLKSQKQMMVIMASIGGVMLLALMFFVVTGIRMNSRLNQLDATLLAVAKRAVALNEGLESLEQATASMAKLTEQVDGLGKSVGEVGGRIDQSVKQAEALTQQIPAKTAEQVASSAKGLAQQVEGLNSRLQAQASAVQGLGREVQSLKATVGNVDKLNREVQSLVTLQRERYLEALQKNAARPPDPARPPSPGQGT